MSTVDVNLSTQLTPALGALLHNYRTESGESAKAVSRRCSLGVVEIAQVELGRAELDVDRLAEAIDAYGVARVVFAEGHCQVQVDLVGGTVSVLSTESTTETPADRILLAYFEMVFTARPMSPETPIPFTDLDLDVLRIVLSSRRNEVTEYLHRMVGPLEESLELVAPTRRTARNALVLLAAAATAAAIIVLPYVASPSPPAVAPIEVQIAEAVVITR